jgi:hypothetical protein
MTDDRYGTLEIDGDHATITFRRHLPYPVIDGRSGGTIETVADEPPAPVEAKRMTGRILVWDPPHVLEHEWRQRIVEDGVVRYELAEDGEGTLLTFTHRGLSVRTAKGFIPGTHAFLDRLEAHLSGAALPVVE